MLSQIIQISGVSFFKNHAINIFTKNVINQCRYLRFSYFIQDIIQPESLFQSSWYKFRHKLQCLIDSAFPFNWNDENDILAHET